MRLNGWQRLYVVLAVPAIGGLIALAFVGVPNGGTMYAHRCSTVLMVPYLSAAEAKQYIKHGVPEADRSMGFDQASVADLNDCWAQMEQAADGRLASQQRREYYRTVVQGAGWTALALAAVYLAGWALGWVWRGFFPRKANA